jgi:hypothetical protein
VKKFMIAAIVVGMSAVVDIAGLVTLVKNV